jgi:hypothetical protein
MPRKGGTSNKKPDETRSSHELNPWLLKRVADRAFSFAARTAMHVSSPSLLSHIWQQRQLGETNSRLARWVMAHTSLASAVPRAIRLPLVSGVSDFVRRNSTFVPPVWQQRLNLPWFRQPRKQEHGSGLTAYAAADWQRTNDTGPGSNDPGRARLLQTAPANKAGQLVHETDEAYPRATKEPLPLMTTHLFSPPVMSGELHGTTVAAMPVRTEPVADRLYLNELTKTAPVTKEKHPVSIVNESYPAVIKNLLSLPVFGKSLPDTTSEHSYHAHTGSMPLMTRQIAAGQPTKDADNFTLSYVSQSRIPNPGIYQSSEVPKLDRRHIKVAQERLPRPLSQFLTPITQRMAPQHRLMEARTHIIGKGIGEGRTSEIGHSDYPKAILAEGKSSRVTDRQAVMPFRASMVKVGLSDEAPVRTEHTLHALISSTQPATLERKTLSNALPGPSKPPITNVMSKGLGRPAVQRTASKPDGLASNSRLPRGAFPSEGSRVLPLRVAAPPSLEVGQAQMREPVINRPTKQVGQKAEVTCAPEDLTNLTMSPDRLSFVTGVRGGMEPGFPEGRREPPSIAGLAIRLPVIESISRTMAFPTQQLFKSAACVPLSDKSEDHGFLRSREYVPSSPSYKYARQMALELPMVSPARPKSDFSTAHSEDLFRHTSDTIPEPTYSRNHNGSELSLAPAGQVLSTKEVPQPTAPESRGDKRGEKEAAPDLRALAREIYPLIKRMLMVERERRPT